MNTIQKIKNLKGKRVIVRADYNVGIVNGKIRDDFRIKSSIATIEFLRKKGAKVILISHIGDDGIESLAPVAKYLNKLFPIRFVGGVVGEQVLRAVEEMKNGDVLLLENLRRESGEKENSKLFTLALASLGEVYVNDAFSVSHRAHASVVGLPKILPAYAGLSLLKEVNALAQVFVPKHPFLAILGGAKFSTKLPLIKNFLVSADAVYVGGALLNTILAQSGVSVGKSLVDTEPIQKSILTNKKLIQTMDVVVNREGVSKTVSVNAVDKNDEIVDVGPETIKLLGDFAQKAKLVVWNGPLGIYERGFDKATKTLLHVLAKSKARVIIGGGDIVAVVEKAKLTDSFTHVSTGGGATLEFLAKKNLVGLKVLGYKNN